MSSAGGMTFGGSPPGSDLSFTDTGSVDIGSQTFVGGLCILEVLDETNNGVVIGGALVVIENEGNGPWAGIIGSSSRATAPTPTFSVVGNAVRVATSGGSGHKIRVLGRRPLRIDYTASL